MRKKAVKVKLKKVKVELNKNAKEWIAALRSREFEQGVGHLRTGDSVEDHEYCCLGVAAVLYQRETDDPVPELIEAGDLPDKVIDWLGLTNGNGAFEGPVEGYTTLADLNDHAGWSFSKIAKFIESNPKGMFTRIRGNER